MGAQGKATLAKLMATFSNKVLGTDLGTTDQSTDTEPTINYNGFRGENFISNPTPDSSTSVSPSTAETSYNPLDIQRKKRFNIPTTSNALGL